MNLDLRAHAALAGRGGRGEVGRSLGAAELAHVEAYLASLGTEEAAARLRFVFGFGIHTGLRCEELARAVTGDLAPVEVKGQGTRWLLAVRGKGAKDRSVALPRRATAVLFEYLRVRGIDAALAGADATIPLLARLAGEGAEPGADTPEASLALWRPPALSPARLYALSKQLFARAARFARAAGDEASAARLARASTHWLRHTYGTRGAAGMPMPTLMREMGHADVRTTMKYVKPDAAERFRQVDKAFE